MITIMDLVKLHEADEFDMLAVYQADEEEVIFCIKRNDPEKKPPSKMLFLGLDKFKYVCRFYFDDGTEYTAIMFLPEDRKILESLKRQLKFAFVMYDESMNMVDGGYTYNKIREMLVGIEFD